MDRIIKKKKPNQAPDWLIYSLKGLLLFLLFWNINKHIPDDYFLVKDKPKKHYDIEGKPYIKEVSFSQLLSTTSPKINHFLQWGNQKIPFIEPEIETETAITYQTFTNKEFAKIWIDSFTLNYKGHILTPNKISAIFIHADSTHTICEDEGDFTTCFFPKLGSLEEDVAIWLAMETEEEKTFFTRIKVTQDPDKQFIANEDANTFWSKLASRDKHKSIDNLTVEKPVFKTNEYYFQWGEWGRYAHGPRGGRRVKIGINDFRKWADAQPFLYKDGEYVPFGMSVSFWNNKQWSNRCYLGRKTSDSPMIVTNDCFKQLVNEVKVGDGFSIFIFIEEDYLKTFSRQTKYALPPFIINDQYIQFTILMEIVEDNFNPQNAPLKLTTSTFSFQLNSALGEDAIVKMDTNNPKNQALRKHYEESESAKIVHITDFKTIRRVITQDDIFLEDAEIEKTYTLSEKIFKTETFPEFYDFNIQPPLIKFRNLSMVLDKTNYPLADFQKSKKGLEFYLGEEEVEVLQLRLTVIPKEGKAVQYTTNSLNKFDLIKRLKKLKPETSLYFDQMVLERKTGEQMVFPLTTALHLQ